MGKRVSFFGSWMLVVAVMLLTSAGPALAVSRTGGTSSSSWSGYFQICDPEGGCFYWSSPDSADTLWYLQYSDTGYQNIQYFQQDQDLTNGTQLYMYGEPTPDAEMYSDFYYENGSSGGSDSPSGLECYSASYSSQDLFWARCDSLATTLYTYNYPPGTVTSYALLLESDAPGSIGVSPYSGSLY
jgi:hypothetical protein